MLKRGEDSKVKGEERNSVRVGGRKRRKMRTIRTEKRSASFVWH